MRQSWIARGLAVLAVLALAVSAQAAGWGTLKGKFVVDGKAPAPSKLKVDKDVAVCAPGGAAPLDESLVVGGKGELANVVVGIFVKTGGKKPDIHESYKAELEKPVEFDNKVCRFEPRVQTLRVGQTLILKNGDTVGHNVKGDLLKNEPFNDNLPSKAEIKKTGIKSAENLPANISCSIHPWMRGFLVVRDDPYVAVSAEDGTFEIKNIPAGTWTFRAWHERPGYVKSVKLKGKTTAWDKGQFEVKIEDGKEVDLGEIGVPADLLKAK
jgi:plastocyanin